MDIRSRVVSHLRHIDEQLAGKVANGLGVPLPEPAKAARSVVTGLPPSDALSIVKRGPGSFAGRKLGILVTDGADEALFSALFAAVDKEKATYEVVAPKIEGATLSSGTQVAAKQKIDGGPSVLFDAVAILASNDGATLLAGDATAKDFATDAFAHCKFIGYSPEAMAVFEKAGMADDLDEGCIELGSTGDVGAFLTACGELRFWTREAKVDLDAIA